ncbi:hypothetical protein V1523DRAFT_444598 [Lipomyces doorenjongii]
MCLVLLKRSSPSLRGQLKYDEKLADIAKQRRNIQLDQEQLMRDAQLAYDQELRLLMAEETKSMASGSPSKSPSTVSTESDSHISDTDSGSTDLESLPELADIFEEVERRPQATNNAQSDTETNYDDSSSSGSSSDGFHDDDEAEQVVDLEHYEFLEWLFCSGFSCDHRLHVMARHTEIGEPSVDIATVTEQNNAGLYDPLAHENMATMEDIVQPGQGPAQWRQSLCGRPGTRLLSLEKSVADSENTTITGGFDVDSIVGFIPGLGSSRKGLNIFYSPHVMDPMSDSRFA